MERNLYDMREVVVYALLVWIVVSLLVGTARVIRRARRTPSPSTGAKRAPGTSAPRVFGPEDSADSGPLIGGTTTASTNTDYLADYPADRGSDPEGGFLDKLHPRLQVPLDTPVPEQPPADPKREPDTLRVPPAEVRPPDLDALPPPLVALGAPTPAAGAAPMAASRDLPTLLAGIRLPCDLLPIIPDDHRSPDHHVSLLTSSAPAEVVGAAVADELERLGYALEPISESELLATRGRDILTLGILTVPELTEIAGRRTYPTAVDGDIVITVDTPDTAA